MESVDYEVWKTSILFKTIIYYEDNLEWVALTFLKILFPHL